MKKKIEVLKLDRNMRLPAAQSSGLCWHHPAAAPLQLAGFAWYPEDRLYRRMPEHPPKPVPEAVDILSNCTAGGQIRFTSNTRRLSLRVTLREKSNMYHMPPTGQSGFDCYIGPVGKSLYISTTRFEQLARQYECELFSFPEKAWRIITINFPLYQGVKKVEVGFEAEAEIKPPPRYDNESPLVFYGTSITQGGCASRPGMLYTNIMSRRINRPFLNFGFSGNGRGEPEVAECLATLKNPGLFVLDYEANCMELPKLRKTMPVFIRILRPAHLKVPILVISRTPRASEMYFPDELAQRLARRDYQRALVNTLRVRGDRRMFFHDGTNLLGKDPSEATVDGGHPTDLGFINIADALTPVVQKIIH